jgi:hypothetical protein
VIGKTPRQRVSVASWLRVSISVGKRITACDCVTRSSRVWPVSPTLTVRVKVSV